MEYIYIDVKIVMLIISTVIFLVVNIKIKNKTFINNLNRVSIL